MLQRLTVVLLSTLLVLGGCRAPVAIPPDDIAEVLRPGDRLRVTHVSGAEMRLVLDRVEDGALIGRDGTAEVRVPREDLARVSRMELAWGRTLLVLVVIPVIVFGLAVWAVSGSFMP